MKTILLGFKDVKGPAEIICGPDVDSNKQVRIITEAKSKGVFPKGIIRLELRPVLEPRSVAVATAKPSKSENPKAEKETK